MDNIAFAGALASFILAAPLSISELMQASWMSLVSHLCGSTAHVSVGRSAIWMALLDIICQTMISSLS